MAEKMKPSGIDWIGDIPNNWETSRIKYHYQISLGKMLQPIQENSTDTLEHYMCSANITWAGVDTSILKQMWFSPAEKKQYRLLDGDLLVSEGGDVAVSCIWRNELDECYLQNAVHRVRQNALSDNRFIYYWLFFLKNYGIVDLICNKATIAHFTKEKFGELPICIMSIDEQVAIADFLDKECVQIDSIAADLEKQIALLQQYKKSLITETVTKGLDKSVPMKDSGVEWIGKIPEHWDVEPIKYRVTFHNGDRGENYPAKSELQSEGIPFINAGHLEGDGLNMDNMDYISEEKYRIMGGVKLRPGDILYCLRGSVGKNAIVDMNQGTVASSLVAIRSVRILAEYLYYCLNSHIEEVQRYLWDNGTAQPNLSADNLGKYKFCIPPVEEQKAIVKYLNNICSQIDNLVIGKKKQLSTIQQHKKSLIYEYVTGKKRVKEVR